MTIYSAFHVAHVFLRNGKVEVKIVKGYPPIGNTQKIPVSFSGFKLRFLHKKITV